MSQIIAGAIALLVGGSLALVTAAGVVNVVSEAPSQPETNVMDYGTRQ